MTDTPREISQGKMTNKKLAQGQWRNAVLNFFVGFLNVLRWPLGEVLKGSSSSSSNKPMLVGLITQGGRTLPLIIHSFLAYLKVINDSQLCNAKSLTFFDVSAL